MIYWAFARAVLQAIAAGWQVVELSKDPAAAQLIDAAQALAAEHRYGRRPKPHDLLTQPRAAARATLLNGKSKKSS